MLCGGGEAVGEGKGGEGYRIGWGGKDVYLMGPGGFIPLTPGKAVGRVK